MILNVSGRTDIVAFYSKWFIKRYQIGYVDVRNPVYPKLVNRLYFNDVDLIVFCTKNPHPILEFLPNIKKPIIFEITLTPYKKDIEPNVPDKKTVIADIKKVSKIIGPENVHVRYDPIFLNPNYPLSYHLKAFEKLCYTLTGYISKIIISFLDDYQNVRKNMSILQIKNFTSTDFKILGENFSAIAKKYHLTVHTCSEYNNLSEYGFKIEACISRKRAFELTGKKFPKWQSRASKYCECAKMVDIGAYNTCPHYCKYCYANFNEEKILSNHKSHNPDSSLLIGKLQTDDEIKIRHN